MGLILNVYRSERLGPFGEAVDCTLGGVSSKAERLCVINVEGPFKPSPDLDLPAVLLLAGNVPGALKIVPADENGEPVKGWTMFGGNYAATSDSRFSKACADLSGSPCYGAVPIHDRIEP